MYSAGVTIYVWITADILVMTAICSKFKEMLEFKEALSIVNSELDNLQLKESPKELYDPVRYILSLGGKRMRPALTLMACSLFSDDTGRAVRAALAYEVFHNFTLLHDDLMDNSGLRRGKETVHKKWNPNIAILSGDVMSILSYRLLSMTECENLKGLLDVFNQTALEVCEGQQLDMNFESRVDVSVEEYIQMIELKTAVLVAACLKSGAMAGGASTTDADLLYNFGRKLGIAFQIRDDYLDVYGDPEVFGKKIGNDILTNKKTYLLIKALELSEGQVKDELMIWLDKKEFNPAEKIEKVTGIFSALGIDKISRDLATSYYDQAMIDLDSLSVPDERTMPLKKFAADLMEREK
jgi:geranylgeranyl diphosphate synthase type II